jgi:transcriptional regulator NrdR family protein
MTIMYCQACHSVAECKVESPQPTTRTLYFENPYINVYVRLRTCEKCGESFKTYEVGELSFKAMRKCIEMNNALGELIDSTWSKTRKEFHEAREVRRAKNTLESPEEKKFEQEMHKEPSYLGNNVISLFKNNNNDLGD